jgi:glycosyltransferase involved in cell wall biosynthesis
MCGAVCFSARCLSPLRASSWFRLTAKKAVQWIYARNSRLNTQSSYVQRLLLQTAGTPGSAGILPIFVPDTGCPAPRSESRSSFLFAGRLNYWKGPQVVIEALASVPQNYTLDLVGTGAFEPELRALAKRLRLESRLTFSGHLESFALQDKYANAFAVVVPSVMPENYPLVIQEAMLAGTPVIASNIGGIPDQVRDGINGLLVAPNDPAALATAMKRLIDNAAFREVIAANALDFIHQEQFQATYHIHHLLNEYEAVIQWRGRKR